MDRPKFFHPLLFALAPVLGFALANRRKLLWDDVAVPLVGSLVLAWLSSVALALLWGDRRRAAVATTLGVAAFFGYGHVFVLIEGKTLFGLELGRHLVTVPLWLLIFGFAIRGVFKSRARFGVITDFLNVTGGSLIALMLIQVAVDVLEPRDWRDVPRVEAFLDAWQETPELTAPPEPPNIYYLILDGYGSSQVFDEILGHDNRGFERALEERGFFVATESRSNYPLTYLSVASSLNMMHMIELASGLGPESGDREVVYGLVDDHRLLRALSSIGYTTVHLGSTWGPSQHNPESDVDRRCGWSSELDAALISTTLLRPLADRLLVADARHRIECTFDTLAHLDREVEGPFFVLAHMVTPHPPYLFGARGERTDHRAADLLNWRPPEAYVAQTQYINRRLIETVEAILADERPSIIVMHGDHGPSTSGRVVNETRPLDGPTRLMRERTGILNAILAPEDCRPELYPGITPVNGFRLLLSCHYGADLPLLDDTVIYTGYDVPFRFRDVTSFFAGDDDPGPAPGARGDEARPRPSTPRGPR